MRKVLLPLLLIFFACNSKPAASKNETTDYLISLDGIGPVTTSMTQEELEKLEMCLIHASK